MYARVITSQVVSGKVDEAVSIWGEKVAPGLKQTKGFKGAYLTGNREANKGVTITLWETKEDADAVDATFPQLLVLFDGIFAAPPSVETYEVLMQV